MSGAAVKLSRRDWVILSAMINLSFLGLLMIALSTVPVASHQPVVTTWRSATPEERHQYEIDRLGDLLEAQQREGQR